MVNWLQSARVRRGRACVLIAAGVLASTLAGCGGHSTPAPLSSAELLSDLDTTAAGFPHGYSTVLVTDGLGTRRFVRASWPRRIAVEMSCRGGRSVTATISDQFYLEVYCAPGQAGGNRTIIGRGTTLTVAAPAATRWSLVVAAGNR